MNTKLHDSEGSVQTQVIEDVDRIGPWVTRLQNVAPALGFSGAGIGALVAIPFGPIAFASGVALGVGGAVVSQGISSFLKHRLKTEVYGLSGASPDLMASLDEKIHSLD